VKDPRFLLIDPHGCMSKSHGSFPILELSECEFYSNSERASSE
jgi:hypothetical protein